MLSIVIDPHALGTAQQYATEAAAYLEWLQQSPVAPGVGRILLPGDAERAARRRCEADGITVDPTTWAEILGAGEKLGLTREHLQMLAGQ